MNYIINDDEWYDLYFKLVHSGDIKGLDKLLLCVNNHLKKNPKDSKGFHRQGSIFSSLSRGDIRKKFEGYRASLLEKAIGSFEKSYKLDPNLYRGLVVPANIKNTKICLEKHGY